MATEFDILSGFVSKDAIKEFEDLGKAIDKSATSAAGLLKSLGAIKGMQDYSKEAAQLAKIVEQRDKEIAILNAKREAKEKDHQNKLEADKAAHLNALERLEKAYQDKVALMQASQEKNAETAATAHASRVEIINQKKADKAIAQAERQAKATAAALDRENAKAFKNSPEGVTQTVGLQAQAQVMKLNAVIASEYTSSLQKLDAQIKLNVIDAQKFVAASDTQNPKYLELIGNTKKLSTEYDRMAKAAGANMTKTNSMYGATFSLTQVMRELPNFAIDARVGFMALSNNLPMLAENFQNVAKEIDVLTGKEKGFKGALAEFGKSLLSLNTIMIVLTTAMVLWGDDLTKWFEELVHGMKVLDEATAKTEAFAEISKKGADGIKSAYNDVKKVSVAFDEYKSKILTSTEALLIYNKTLGDQFGHFNDINAAMANFNSKADAYMELTWKMAVVTEYSKKASEAYVNQNLEKQKSDELYSKWYDSLTNKQIAAIFKLGVSREDAINETINVRNKRRDAEVEKFRKENKIYADLQKQAQDDAIKFAKEHGLQILDIPDPKTGSSRVKKTFSEILVAQEFYNQERAKLVEKMAALEDDITKSRITGELNGYEQRKKAAELYYNTTKSLAEIDRDVAISTANEKLAHEKKVIKDKYNDNVRKFGGNSAEAQKSETELNTGNATLEKNNALDILKITDDFNKKVLDGSRKQASQLYTIQQDMYADEVYLLEQTQTKKLAALGIADTRQKQKTSTKSGIELVNSALGGTSKNTAQEIEDAALSANQVLDIEQQGYMARLNARDKFTGKLLVSGKEEEEIYKKLGEIRVKREVNAEKALGELELANLKSVEESKAEVMSKSIDVLKSLWDSYYQYQADKLDETLTKQTKINNEAVKQYEDETDAGKHSAKELSDFKDRTAAYQASQDEENARKKKELAKQEFLEKQAFAVAEIWINYAINVAKEGVNLVAQGWLLASAIASTALVAAQTIPAFAEGGTMGKDGKALIGDGGKNELIMTPTGDWYVSPKVPTVVDMQAGTKIFPDINKLDLNSFLALAQVQPQMLKTDNLEKEIKGLRQDVRNQKQGNFYGMPLIRQLNNSSRYSARKRGLMN